MPQLLVQVNSLCSWPSSQSGTHYHQHQYRMQGEHGEGPGIRAPVQCRTWQHCDACTYQHHSHHQDKSVNKHRPGGVFKRRYVLTGWQDDMCRSYTSNCLKLKAWNSHAGLDSSNHTENDKTRDPWLRVPPGGLVLRIFTS